MNVAVRYFSTYGRTQAIAEAIAAELGEKAVSITDEPQLAEPVDVLFLGGAPYWSIMDPALETYVRSLDPAVVGRVVLFTTSNWSHRTALGLRAELEQRGITVAPGHFYAHMSQIEQSTKAARAFARDELLKAAHPELARGEGAVGELVGELLTVGVLVAGVALVATTVVRAGKTAILFLSKRATIGLA